jgi:hypothetical protein
MTSNLTSSTARMVPRPAESASLDGELLAEVANLQQRLRGAIGPRGLLDPLLDDRWQRPSGLISRGGRGRVRTCDHPRVRRVLYR